MVWICFDGSVKHVFLRSNALWGVTIVDKVCEVAGLGGCNLLNTDCPSRLLSAIAVLWSVWDLSHYSGVSGSYWHLTGNIWLPVEICHAYCTLVLSMSFRHILGSDLEHPISNYHGIYNNTFISIAAKHKGIKENTTEDCELFWV